MKLDLSEILTHVGMRFPYDVDEPPLVDEDIECATPIAGKITFTNTGNILLINGAVDTSVVLACSRCLAYFNQAVHVPVDEQFPMEVHTGGPRGRHTHVVIEEDESPIAGKLFEGHLFDLTELLRQGITLSLPTRPLHDEACKGLCAICGENLNENACECKPEPANPALAKLAVLLDDQADTRS